MLMFGSQTAGQLERGLGMSRHRVARGLDELLSAGAVDHRPGNGRRALQWTPMEPSSVVPALRERRHASARAARRSMSLHEVLPGTVPLDDGMRHLPSRELTRARLAELVGAVRHEHLAMQPERSYEAESARSAVPMDRTLLTRGVRMRVLGALPADAEDPLVAHGRQEDDLRPEYRQATETPVKLIVMDRHTALLPVSPEDLDHGYLEITQDAVVAALVALFQRQWETAAARQERCMARITLSERERDLLRLLAQGHTDASAARAMRISRRTVSNTLRALMDLLGVENRFQLGLAVGALSLIEPPGTGPAAMEGV
ncbi:helix-turn-helix transcriptional regulator [Plantactinospora sp. KLBMP9567]|uniref:helix-turn-helix transcriptional regulator n=1 Tax=Plantactinospora sp. KLBMP9567 TaxID=3085900 RepID=UPI0029814966|nr:LuxR C-terminal-related transcriptional regulator [Plantactinospora sp. KLBMP9567]MDW5330317.1 LuxR C-terminal-related transcriptional regulator [Plantactinospora sp. KLBMP9567]